MKTGKNIHNLGSEHCPGSQNWFYLVIEEYGTWRVQIEKDYDTPDKEGYTADLQPSDFTKHKVYDEPLTEVLNRKLSQLGLKAN
jgi:hypothetical protein